MSDKPAPRTTRKIGDFNDRIGPLPLTGLDWVLVNGTLAFIALVGIHTLRTVDTVTITALLRAEHYHLSRYTLALALLLAGIAAYIGLIKHADVTPYFRRGTYVIVGTMTFEALLGAAMYFILGLRPGEEVHLIYGAATVLSLPFFIFVEVTAQKRPAMGSYIWGFLLLAGIIFRSISTGPVG